MALRVLYYGRFLAVSALWPFLTVPKFGLQCVIVVNCFS